MIDRYTRVQVIADQFRALADDSSALIRDKQLVVVVDDRKAPYFQQRFAP